MESKQAFISTPVAILLGCFMIAMALLLNGGIIKIGKSSGSAANQAAAPAAPAAPTAPTAPAAPSVAKVSTKDAPMLGDKNAPLTIVEFSDYECPFCKRHFDQTHTQIKKDYIDTGKAKLYFRNYPLPFHDPLATTEAIAALCARDQGGDSAYFKMHDEIFKQTTSNGNGLTKDKLWAMAGIVGVNADTLKTCTEAEKYKDVITKDVADGGAAGVSGTPSFVVAKSSSSDTVEGTLLVGAQPYSAFQSALDGLK